MLTINIAYAYMYARIVPTVATSSVYLSKFISGSQEK